MEVRLKVLSLTYVLTLVYRFTSMEVIYIYSFLHRFYKYDGQFKVV